MLRFFPKPHPPQALPSKSPGISQPGHKTDGEQSGFRVHETFWVAKGAANIADTDVIWIKGRERCSVVLHLFQNQHPCSLFASYSEFRSRPLQGCLMSMKSGSHRPVKKVSNHQLQTARRCDWSHLPSGMILLIISPGNVLKMKREVNIFKVYSMIIQSRILVDNINAMYNWDMSRVENGNVKYCSVRVCYFQDSMLNRQYNPIRDIRTGRNLQLFYLKAPSDKSKVIKAEKSRAFQQLQHNCASDFLG